MPERRKSCSFHGFPSSVLPRILPDAARVRADRMHAPDSYQIRGCINTRDTRDASYACFILLVLAFRGVRAIYAPSKSSTRDVRAKKGYKITYSNMISHWSSSFPILLCEYFYLIISFLFYSEILVCLSRPLTRSIWKIHVTREQFRNNSSPSIDNGWNTREHRHAYVYHISTHTSRLPLFSIFGRDFLARKEFIVHSRFPFLAHKFSLGSVLTVTREHFLLSKIKLPRSIAEVRIDQRIRSSNNRKLLALRYEYGVPWKAYFSGNFLSLRAIEQETSRKEICWIRREYLSRSHASRTLTRVRSFVAIQFQDCPRCLSNMLFWTSRKWRIGCCRISHSIDI